MPENPTDESIVNRCDKYGSLSGVSVEYHEQYRVPEEYEVLCRACAKELNQHTAAEMADEELDGYR